MTQVIYSGKDVEIEGYTTLSSFEDVISFITSNEVDLLSIPVNDEAIHIVESIVYHESTVKTIHLQETDDLLSKLKIFFKIAQLYEMHEVKRDIIMKHPLIDTCLKNRD